MRCTDCNQPVKPVVAFDIDGTCGDYHGHFLKFAAHWLGDDSVQWKVPYDGSTDLATYLGVDKATYRMIKLAYRQGGMKRSMPVTAEAPSVINFLRESGVEVWITTTRPYLRLDNVDPDTRHWLKRHGILYDGLIYDELKYDRLVEIVGGERICGVVEDLPEQFDHAWELGLRPILLSSEYNKATPRDPSARNLKVAGQRLLDQVQEWREAHATDR